MLRFQRLAEAFPRGFRLWSLNDKLCQANATRMWSLFCQSFHITTVQAY